MANPKDHNEEVKKISEMEPRQDRELEDRDLDKAAGGIMK